MQTKPAVARFQRNVPLASPSARTLEPFGGQFAPRLGNLRCPPAPADLAQTLRACPVSVKVCERVGVKLAFLR